MPGRVVEPGRRCRAHPDLITKSTQTNQKAAIPLAAFFVCGGGLPLPTIARHSVKDLAPLKGRQAGTSRILLRGIFNGGHRRTIEHPATRDIADIVQNAR
jgi:hypothetical protein